MSDIFKVKQNNSWVGIPALVGATGPKGDKGDTGETGPRGLQGIQGEVGPQGPQGIQGIQGETGASAGFGTPTASASGLPVGSNPTVSISSSGPDTAKVFSFNFGIPESGVSQADWNETDTEADSYIRNKPNLSAVATSGSYIDLSNRPNLSTVATSGSYNDLTNKPTIPSQNKYFKMTSATFNVTSSSYQIGQIVLFDIRKSSSSTGPIKVTFGSSVVGKYVVWESSGSVCYDAQAGSTVTITKGSSWTYDVIMMMRVS